MKRNETERWRRARVAVNDTPPVEWLHAHPAPPGLTTASRNHGCQLYAISNEEDHHGGSVDNNNAAATPQRYLDRASVRRLSTDLTSPPRLGTIVAARFKGTGSTRRETRRGGRAVLVPARVEVGSIRVTFIEVQPIIIPRVPHPFLPLPFVSGFSL